jgi:hypothetical protein
MNKPFPGFLDSGLVGDLGKAFPEHAPAMAQPSPYVPQPPTEDPPEGDLAEPDYGLSDDMAAAASAENDMKSYMYDVHFPRSAGKAQPVPVGGENWGRDGKESYEEAFKNAPPLMREGMGELGDTAAREGKALEQAYGRSIDQATNLEAIRAARSQENFQEEQRRIQELDAKTQAYSKDLADTGKFWRSPGNIIAAIGYALMPLAGGDPTAGVKLINQAIQQDLHQRKVAADTHLGALRSNLDGYRKIAGDRETGDMFAEAQAYKVAAMEIQRVGAQFQGEKAKASTKMMVAEFTQKHNLLQMEAYRRLVQVMPHLQDPRVAGMMGNVPGFEGFAGGKPAGGGAGGGGRGGPGAGPGRGGPVAGHGGGQVMVGRGQLMPGEELMPGAVVAAADEQPDGGPGHDSDFEAKLGRGKAENLGRRVHGAAERLEEQKANYYYQALKQADTPEQAKKIYYAKLEKADEVVQSAAAPILQKGLNSSAVAYSNLQKDLRDLSAKMGGDHNKLNKFLGKMRAVAPGANFDIDQLADVYGLGDAKHRQAAMRIRQQIAGARNTYFNEISGGAVSEGEEKRLREVISSQSSWSDIENFAKMRSTSVAAEISAAEATMDPYQRMIYRARIGLGPSGLDVKGAPAKTKPKAKR